MSYISWRNIDQNESKYMAKANATEFDEFSAFKLSTFTNGPNEIVGATLNSILMSEHVSFVGFLCSFAEYLHQEYGVSSEDCEILARTATHLLYRRLKLTAMDSTKMFADMFGSMITSLAKEQQKEEL